ncbi:unnamed protein product [Nezara viridula]|uniref:Uncharacterized protein n=1 Tax=Nezara viridula TaxID=85310 RepID=A0A9P0EG64_NEZVI|nr:unnamed protein product [Nezara viridula]
MTAENPQLIKFGIGYVIFAVIALIFGVIQILAAEIASRNIMARIKTAYLSKMLLLGMDWYDQSQEQFVSTLSHDLQKMAFLFDSKITIATEMLSFFFFGCTFGMITSWKVALLTLGMMLIAVIIMFFILQASKKKGKLMQEYNRKCTKIASEVLGNIRTVAAYGGEYLEMERYKSTLKIANKFGLKYTAMISVGKAFNYFQMCTCYLVAYYFSVRLFLIGDFDPGYISVILTSQINTIYYCTFLLNTIFDLYMATDSAYSVMSFLDNEASYNKSIEQGLKPDTFEADVCFRNVTFSYPTNLHTKVLHDLTLDIEPGKVTAVVGTSGAGKSTIVSLISGLYDVSAGQILIGGVDIKKLNVSWLRNQIGVVGQEPTLFDASIEENIRYGKTNASLDEIVEAAKISYAHGFVEKLPLEGRVMEKGSHSELMGLKGYYYSLAKVQELEEKDKILILNQKNFPEEELIEEVIPLIDDDLELPEKKKILRLNIKHLKNVVVCFLAICFITTTSTFLPTFQHIFCLFCQSFTYTKDELRRIALVEAGYLFGLGATIFFSVVLSGVMSTIATRLWLEKLQTKVFNKITSIDISWFDRSGNSPNACLEVLTNSPSIIESVAGDKAAQVIIFLLSVLFSIGYSLFISSSVTLVNLPIFLIFFIVNIFRMKPRESDSRSALLSTRSTKVATEYVQNIKTIQILNCQKYVITQYQDMLLQSKKEAIDSIIWYAAVYGISKSVIRWSFGITFIYGAYVIANSNILGTSLIGIVNTLSLTSMLTGPTLILTSQYPAARQAIKQLYRIADSKPSLNTLTDRGIKPDIIGNIVFQDVAFSYPTRENLQVLNKLNLKIEAGKTVALLIDGTDINDINVRYLRSQMGLVSQEPVLFDMTIKENILYGLEGEVTMDKVIEAAKIANIHNFIMKLPQAYDSSVGERGSKLSGGQKQRIAIARAVLRNPKILLLDEATSALDTENEKAVQEALENASVGRTNIVIAHRLSTIRKADKIVVIQSGVVVEEGNHEQLMERRGYYFNLLTR